MITETLGRLAGGVAAPLFALTSALRRARTFHPRGDLVQAEIVPSRSAEDRYASLGDVLSGHALVRLSSALAKHGERWPDVLGFALRFSRDSNLLAGDQDLLFATIRRPWTMGIAPFLTNTHDYLANDYFAVSPFSAPGFDQIYFRLHPRTPHDESRGDGRRMCLEDAMARSRALFVLEGAPGPHGPWTAIADVRLTAMASFDDRHLHFDPFRDGRGIRPTGFVHALRRFIYPASQHARDAVQSPSVG